MLFSGEKKKSDVKDTKTALVSFLVNRFLCLFKMKGQLTPTWGNLPRQGPTYPDIGQLTPTRTNLPRHRPTYPDRANLPRHGAIYPDIGQLTPTWANLPRHGANLPRHGPTYPDMGHVGPCVTRSAVSQTVSYVTIALPFIDITN